MSLIARLVTWTMRVAVSRARLVLVVAGAAVLLEQHELSGERLLHEIDRLLGDAPALAAIGVAAHQEGARHRGDALIDLVREVAAR